MGWFMGNLPGIDKDFLSAASAGDIPQMLRLLDRGANINTTDFFKNNVSWYLSKSRALTPSDVDLLVSRGLDINAEDSAGATIISSSVTKKGLSISFIQSLLQNGFDITTKDSDGNNVIAQCAKQEILTVESLRFLADKCDINPNEQNHEGETALMLILLNADDKIQSGKVTIEEIISLVDEFLTCEENEGTSRAINETTIYGWTPIMYAARTSGTPDAIFEHLVKRGANPDAVNKEGKTALLLAAKNNALSLQTMECFHRLGADFNCRDRDGKAIYQLMQRPEKEETTRLYLRLFDFLNDEEQKAYLRWMGTSFIRNNNPALLAFCLEKALADGEEDDTKDLVFLMETQLRNSGISVNDQRALALTAAAVCHPEKHHGFMDVVYNKKGQAFKKIMEHPCLFSIQTQVNLLSILSEGRRGILSMQPLHASNLVPVLLNVFNEYPGLVVEFMKKRVGKQVENWINDGIEGAEMLVSKMVPYLKKDAGLGKDNKENIVLF